MTAQSAIAIAEPLGIFDEWLKRAKITEANDPEAMTLATADAKGNAHARMVLLKSYDEKGFVFASNYQSNKGKQLLQNEGVTLLFYWKSLRRQVRIAGKAEKTDAKTSDTIFYARSEKSQVASILSKQSAKYLSVEKLAGEVNNYTKAPKRPEHWGGIIVIPESFEFWEDGRHRVHIRVFYEKIATEVSNSAWTKSLLYP